MPGPFPGMDPYLELPRYWESFHDRLIFHLGTVLQDVLPPEYVAEFRHRVQVVLASRDIIPDVAIARLAQPAGATAVLAPMVADEAVRVEAQLAEVEERFIEVLHIPDGELVAVLELASPTNKMDPRGREAYREKQRSVLASDAHLVEIDLLRGGSHWVSVPESLLQKYRPFDNVVCVSRASARLAWECYFRTLRDPLPAVAVPLLPGDPDAVLQIQVAFDRAYDQGRYASRLPYDRPPTPRLREEEERWASGLLREKGLLNPE